MLDPDSQAALMLRVYNGSDLRLKELTLLISVSLPDGTKVIPDRRYRFDCPVPPEQASFCRCELGLTVNPTDTWNFNLEQALGTH